MGCTIKTPYNRYLLDNPLSITLSDYMDPVHKGMYVLLHEV